jgi:hypothetical protein
LRPGARRHPAGHPLYERFGFATTGSMVVTLPDGVSLMAAEMRRPIRGAFAAG